jgi:hypothetical protein
LTQNGEGRVQSGSRLASQGWQGIGVYFQVPGNYQVLEAIFTAKSNKFLFSGPFLFSFFDFFDFTANFFFKACCFSRNFDVEKVNADALQGWSKNLTSPGNAFYTMAVYFKGRG